MDKKSNTKIVCPFCNKGFKEPEDLFIHVENVHSDIIPEGIVSGAHFLYFNRTNKLHGQCVMCKKPTDWNSVTNKYHRFCDNPKCKERYVEEFKKRMIGKYGKTTLLNDPDQQRKMLANRSISGTYKWSDGKNLSYTGTYEKDFLQFLDVLMNFDSNDIMTPSPHTYYYEYEGERKFYIPDAFIPSLNLEIEIKDGGDNPNTHGKIVAVDKVKERLKDDVMKSQRVVSYIKLVNKEYGPFFDFLNIAKSNFIKGFENKPIFITESIGDVKASCLHCGSLIGYTDDWDNSGICYKCGNKYNEKPSNDNDIVTENTIKTVDDTYLNFDKWKTGANNVLFITGLSGSGKSSLSKDLAKEHNAVYIEMDLIYTIPNFIRSSAYGENLSEGEKLIKEIFDDNDLWGYNVFEKGAKPKLLEKCFKLLYKYTKENPNRLFIFECIHIYYGYDFLEKIIDKKNTPLIIKGVSALKSTNRKLKRYYSSSFFNLIKDLCINSIEDYEYELKANIHDDKILQEYRKKHQVFPVTENITIGTKKTIVKKENIKENIGCMAPIVAADEGPLEKDYLEETQDIDFLNNSQIYIIIRTPHVRKTLNKINILNVTDDQTEIIVSQSNGAKCTMLKRNRLHNRLSIYDSNFKYAKCDEYIEIRYTVGCSVDNLSLVYDKLIDQLLEIDLIMFGFIQTVEYDSEKDKLRFINKLLGEKFMKSFYVNACDRKNNEKEMI